MVTSTDRLVINMCCIQPPTVRLKHPLRLFNTPNFVLHDHKLHQGPVGRSRMGRGVLPHNISTQVVKVFGGNVSSKHYSSSKEARRSNLNRFQETKVSSQAVCRVSIKSFREGVGTNKASGKGSVRVHL